MRQRAKAILRRARALAPFRDPEDNGNVLILGSGRSGTTWLAEQVALNSEGRIIFEPLHPQVAGKPSWAGSQSYVPPKDPCPTARAFFDPILDGRFRSVWTDRYNHRFIYQHRVIKMIRGNLMLGWFAATYPDARIALVLRRPFDVAMSQIRCGWPSSIDHLLDQPKLLEDYGDCLPEAISMARSPFELNIVQWCIENGLALRQFEKASKANTNLAVYEYEELKQDPDLFRSFLAFCGAKSDAHALRHLRKPSRAANLSDAEGRNVDTPYEPSDRERAYARQILTEFGFERFAPR